MYVYSASFVFMSVVVTVVGSVGMFVVVDNELAEKDDAVILLYIDLQKVLLSPSLQASACYYKRKTRSVHITTQFMTRRVRKQHVMFGMRSEGDTFSCLLLSTHST